MLRIPGRSPARGRNQLVLDFSRREVRDHVYGQIKAVLSSAPIAYVKWDMNRLRIQYGTSFCYPGDALMEAGLPLPVFWGDYQSLQLCLSAI